MLNKEGLVSKIYFVPTRYQRLQAEADRFLRKHGYRSDGRKTGTVDYKQSTFECFTMIKTPTGGQRKK